MVLLVDDDVCFLRVIPHMLKMQNMKVTAINKVEEAQNWLDDNDCDTIIIDLHMRETKGLDLLKWIESRAFNLKIIILENTNRDNYSDFQLEHNYESITVPFNGEQLIKAISK